MAAADDRGALSAAEDTAAPRRAAVSGLAVIGVGLALVLLAVAWVQGRQAQMLSQSVQVADDFAVLHVFQAETEYLRLRHAWHLATDPDLPLDRAALQLRYDVFVSRVGLLREGRPGHALLGEPGAPDPLAALEAFVAQADALLGPDARQPPTREAMRALAPALEALGPLSRTMSIRAAHGVAEQISARNETVRRHNQIGIALTVSLSALSLAFALLALRQMRQLEKRGAALEELAERLRLARRDAESASEAKSVFLANMSHEIRTPFHGLMGMLSLLRETGLAPKQIDYLRTATESADHLLAILNDILDMSQLESGRMTLSPVPVDLRTLLRDIEALMRPQALARQLALYIDVEPGVPERVLADPTRVKQVVFNLLSNAIKFSEHGHVALALKSTGGHPGAGRPELVFTVQDTGIGMDEATLGALFNRFMQGDGSRQRRHGGAGLGLEISRNLARLMGGDIVAESRLGLGSTFTFRMPQVGVQAFAAEPGPPGLPVPQRPRPLRVLVAEDHPVNRQYMAALLDGLGHEATFAADGREALDIVRRPRTQGFDLVLMDLHMPVMDGVAATRAIRALPDRAAATVPIVALTADAFSETRERCLVAGMNDFLTKPVSPPKLAAALRRLFGANAGPAGADDAPPPEAPRHEGAAELANVPPLDPAAIAAALQAMPRERLAAMIHAFLDQAPSTVQRLRVAVRDAQPLELRVNAHAARGAALNLGLAALAATAGALHEGASHLPAIEIARLVQRFDELLPLTRRAAIAAGLAPPAQAPAAQAVSPGD